MHIRKHFEADVTIGTSAFGFIKMVARTQRGLDFLIENGFLGYNHHVKSPVEISKPMAQRIVWSFLAPDKEVTVHAPEFERQPNYRVVDILNKVS